MSRSVASLAGQWAVVTGASGGIGRRIAYRMAEAGADILVHAHRSIDQANQLAGEIRTLGRQTHVVAADLSESTQVRAFVQRCWHLTGGADIWVNNAGADVLTGSAAKASFEAKLERLWQMDVVGTMIAARDVGHRMRTAGRGVILNMGWDQAAQGMEGDSGEMFAATKGAIMAFTRSLAKSLAPQVRVNCLAPGWIRTQWGDHASKYWNQRARQESLRLRWGTPDDVAHAAVFLASPAADFITGHVLPINGGFAGYETWNPPPENG